MNGPTPEAEAKTSNSPKTKSTATIGIIHHSFRCQRKESTSPKTPKFTAIVRKKAFINTLLSHYVYDPVYYKFGSKFLWQYHSSPRSLSDAFGQRDRALHTLVAIYVAILTCPSKNIQIGLFSNEL